MRLYDPETDGTWVWTSTGMVNTDVDPIHISLIMKKELMLYLYNNIHSLDPSLNLSEKFEPRQHAVTSGRIDTLAKDSE